MASVDDAIGRKKSLPKALGSFPGLSFTPERAEILLALIRHQEAEFRDRSRHRRVLLGKGDGQRVSRAADEAKDIRKAAKKLTDLISRADERKIDWADAIRTQCIVTNLQRSVLGANLPPGEWRTEIIHLLSCFVGVADARHQYYSETPPDPEVEYPKHSHRSFATTLAYIYVAASGKFGGKVGKAGFPKFLLNVHPLLPLSYGSMNDASFARLLRDSISAETLDDLKLCETQPYRAEYTADLLTAYFRHRPL